MLVMARGKYLLRQPLTWHNAGFRLRTNTYRFGDTKPLPVIVEKSNAYIQSSGDSGERPNECRVVSTEVEAVYNELTTQINALIKQRSELLQDNFLTFELLKPTDCEKIVDCTYQTKPEANAGLRQYKAKYRVK
jgi:hypothetical protein